MKNLSIYHPRTVGNAFIEFDRAMESIFGNNILNMPELRYTSRHPHVDVRETDKSYDIVAELPGYDEKEIELSLENKILTIESKKEEAKEEKKDDSYLIRERHSSSFKRSFKLPDDADSEKITATFKNGILSLEIGKRAEAAKKQIAISAA